MCTATCSSVDKNCLDFFPPAEIQTQLNDAVANFIQKHHPIGRLSATRVLDALVGDSFRMTDRRFMRSLLEDSKLKPHITDLLDVGFFMRVKMLWVCEWDLTQRAVFAANPVPGSPDQRAFLELRSLYDLHKSRGVEGLRLALNLAFYESLESKEYNEQLLLYHAHQNNLDRETRGSESVIIAFMGISRLLYATEIYYGEVEAAWNRLLKIACALSLQPPYGSKAFGIADCDAFAETARFILGSRPSEDPIDPPPRTWDAWLMRVAAGTNRRPMEFTHALDQLGDLSIRLQTENLEVLGTKLWDSVSISKTPDLRQKLQAGSLKFHDFWEHICWDQVSQEVKERQVRASPIPRTRIMLSGILRNLPLDLLEDIQESSFRDRMCALLFRLIFSLQEIGFVETVVYDLLRRSKYAKSASTALHLGVWLDHIAERVASSEPTNSILSLIDSSYPINTQACFMDSTSSKEAIYTTCIDLMRGAIEAGLQVIRLVDNTDWGRAAANDWRKLDCLLQAVKKVQLDQIPPPTWRQCLSRWDLHVKNCSKCVAGKELPQTCDKGGILHSNAQRKLKNLYSRNVDLRQAEMQRKFPPLVVLSPEAPDTSDGAKTKPKGGLPTDQKLPTVARPSNKFPIRLQRGHTCASRCERFVFGELTTTSVRFL